MKALDSALRFTAIVGTIAFLVNSCISYFLFQEPLFSRINEDAIISYGVVFILSISRELRR